MTGYVATWDEWARRAAEAQAAHPDCTSRPGCPAGADPEAHLHDCPVWRRAWWVGRALAGLALRA